MRTGGEHEAGRSQVVVLSAPLRSVTKYCYGHLAHGDVALLPQPLLLGLGRGARVEAEGPHLAAGEAAAPVPLQV